MRALSFLAFRLNLALRESMAYRYDFFMHFFFSIAWLFIILVPYQILFHYIPRFQEYTYDSALLVASFFTILLGFIEGVLQPSLVKAVENFRNGEMDYILLKPIDPTFFILTSKIQIWNGTDFLAGAGLLAYSLFSLHTLPSFLSVLCAGILLFCGVLILYSIALFALSLGVLFVKVDNLIYLFLSLYDLGRFPVTFFRAPFRFLFTFVLPVGIMTTYPAEVLQGRNLLRFTIEGIVATGVFFLISRLLFFRAIRQYMSAGG